MGYSRVAFRAISGSARIALLRNSFDVNGEVAPLVRARHVTATREFLLEAPMEGIP